MHKVQPSHAALSTGTSEPQSAECRNGTTIQTSPAYSAGHLPAANSRHRIVVVASQRNSPLRRSSRTTRSDAVSPIALTYESSAKRATKNIEVVPHSVELRWRSS